MRLPESRIYAVSPCHIIPKYPHVVLRVQAEIIDSVSLSHDFLYSISTTPPNALIVSTIFVPSSFVTPSFITFGTLSTNFFESIKLNPSIDLTSLMIFDFAAASNDFNFNVNNDFSAGAGAASSSGSAAAAAAGAAPPATAGAAKDMSGMFRRD